MPDALRHDELQAAKSTLYEIVRGSINSVVDHPDNVAIAALGCAFLAACRANDVEPTDILDQLEDAEDTGDLPAGVLDAFVFVSVH